MANTALIVAGSRITAALIASIAPLEFIKPADQPLTSSTAMQNDTALFLPVAAGATYDFGCYLDYEAAGPGTGDLAWTWALPAGATLRYASGHVNSGAFVFTSYLGSATVIASGQGAGNILAVTMEGSLVTGSTAGTLQLRWAQNTSNATPTIVHAQSKIRLTRIT